MERYYKTTSFGNYAKEIACGFFNFISMFSIQFLNCEFSGCSALNSAYGAYLQDSSSVQFIDCQLVANKATNDSELL